MKIGALITQYRHAAQDWAEPPLVTDEHLITLFNEAEMEAVIRGRLIHEFQQADVCQIAVLAEQSYHRLHRVLYELTHIRFVTDGGNSQHVCLKSTEELDRIYPGWREEAGTPEFAVQDDTGIRLVPTPDAAGVLHLEGYRLPISAMATAEDEPEINRAHHGYLYHWVLHRVFSMPDSDLFDPERSVLSEREFTRHFGLRPDADLRRIVREDEAHTIKPMPI